MVFSSMQFIFIFMPVFFACYYAVPMRLKNAVLLLGSLSFYAVGTVKAPEHFIIFILSMLVDFGTGLAIEGRAGRKKLFLWLGVSFHLIVLGFYKYFSFVFGEIAGLFPEAGLSLDLEILLPIGISFYTFQGISYIADVYRGTVRAERSLLNYCVYISMFPQLIAGPIVNYTLVKDELHSRRICRSDVIEGLGTFIFGMGIKVLLANPIGKLWTDVNTIGFESLSTPLAWMGIAAFSFQLYFDFFGYSLMAIGLGRMMGFTLPKNFDFPYMAASMTEFWRRWHMSLGSWFREYVYIPLGGNREGGYKTVRNLLVVWLLTGIWHGAGWNFLIWGFVLFLLIALEKYVIGGFLSRHSAAGHIYMIFMIPLTWAIFAVDDIGKLGVLFTRLFPFFGQGAWSVFRYDYIKYLSLYWPFFLAAVLLSTRLPYKLLTKLRPITAEKLPESEFTLGTIIKRMPVGALLAVIILCSSVYCMYRGLDDPFLYFRF